MKTRAKIHVDWGCLDAAETYQSVGNTVGAVDIRRQRERCSEPVSQLRATDPAGGIEPRHFGVSATLHVGYSLR